MDTERLNRWLTLGANLAVLAGIALILIELNQNADLMRAQMIQARTDQSVAKYDSMVHSDYWARIWSKRFDAGNDADWIMSLTQDELQRVRYYYFREYEDLRGQYFLYADGYVSDEYWTSAIQEQMLRLVDLAVALEVSWSDEMRTDPFRVALITAARESGRGDTSPEGQWQSGSAN